MLDLSVLDQYEVFRESVSTSSTILYVKNQAPPANYPSTIVIKKRTISQESLRECKVHQELSGLTPLVVHCYGFKVDAGSCRLYMEHCTQGSLGEVFSRRRSPWTETELIKLWAGLAKAVAALHEINYVHRDLKPGNFFVTADNQVKLGDLGDADFILEQDVDNEQSKLHGTPAYFSDEQHKVFAECLISVPRTQSYAEAFANDLFALALTFLASVKNTPSPPRLSAGAPEEDIVKVVREAGYCEDFARLIFRMRSNDPQLRVSAREVLETLRTWVCRCCERFTAPEGLFLCYDRVCWACAGNWLQDAIAISSNCGGDVFCQYCGQLLEIERYFSSLPRIAKERTIFQLANTVKFSCNTCGLKYSPLEWRERDLVCYRRKCVCGVRTCSWCRSPEQCRCRIQLIYD